MTFLLASTRALLLAAVLPLLALAGRAGNLWTVDITGAGQFLQIQAAVDAAQDGDSIVVHAGNYSGFTIAGKGLHVFADAGVLVQVNGQVIVQAVPAGSATVLSGLELLGPGAAGSPVAALTITGNLGHARVQGCTVRGGAGLVGGSCFSWHDGAPAVQVLGSLRVALADCLLVGGNGYGDASPGHYDCRGGDGGAGLLTSGSAVVLYDCELQGGHGGQAGSYGGHGGPGLHVLDFGAWATGCLLRGGNGGLAWDFIFAQGGNGGDGLRVEASGQAQLLDNTYLGGTGGGSLVGMPGAAGMGITGTGAVIQLPGTARELEGPRIAPGGARLPLTVRGEPGDRVRIARALRPGFFFQLASSGVWLVPYPSYLTFQPLGTIPASGVLEASAALPPLAPGSDVRNEVLQLLVVDPSGTPFLGSALHVDVVRCSGAPVDCNANGVDDACDIHYGLSPDLNTNGVPDECEPTTTWHVDASAPPGGNGSAASPFQTIGAGVAIGLPGDTVLVRDGVYAGPGNRGMDFTGRDLSVVSVNGPTACVIDCEGADRAFVLTSGEGPGARIEGFTIRNGFAGNNGAGGAILLQGSAPLIALCRFDACTAGTAGGALAAIDSAARIRDCSFTRSRSLSFAVMTTTGGGGLYCRGVLPRIERCLFAGNESGSSGGGASLQVLGAGPGVLRGCRFLDNTAYDGGGLYFAASSQALLVENCLLAGNVAVGRGGGVHISQSNALLADVSLVANHAFRGGGLYVLGQFSLVSTELSNSIVWGNTVTDAGPGIALANAGKILVRHSDVQGGLAAVWKESAGAIATWGAGNIDLPPLFVDEDGPDNDPLTFLDNNYRLGPGSPCIDAADNALVPADLLDIDGDGNTTEPVPFDLDGNPRFVDDPAVPDTGSGAPPIVDMGAYEKP